MSRVEVGLFAFAICWASILAVHAAAAVYYVVVAIFYWQLKATHLTAFLEYYSIGMSSDHFHTIALVHAGYAVPHGVCVLLMLVGSLASRRPSFHLPVLPSSRFRTSRFSKVANHPRVATIHAGFVKAGASLAATRVGGAVTSLNTAGVYIFHKLFGRSGLLDVNGKHYGVVFVCRELFETSLQTVQAYKMSCLLPRATVNRMYTGLIVLNCWLTTLICALFSTRTAHERFFRLLFDCVLDLVTSAGITLTIVQYYLKNYDWSIGGFWNELWVDDKWFAQAKNEFQIVFVTSWIDLAMRMVFAVGAMASLGDMKALLMLRVRTNRVQHKHSRAGGQQDKVRSGFATVPAPLLSGSVGTSVPLVMNASSATVSSSGGPRRATVMKPSSSMVHGRITAITSLVLAAWGLVLMVFHLHASSIPTLSQCQLQVRPWGSATPHYYLVRLNCDQLRISGTSQEVEAQWRQFGRATVERILIRHCPALEMPALLQDFAALNALKLYNSSIVRWGADAAITAMHHPQIALVYLVRVAIPNGALPDGLLSTDTPSSLQELTVCVSNLRQLPDDLDTLAERHRHQPRAQRAR